MAEDLKENQSRPDKGPPEKPHRQRAPQPKANGQKKTMGNNNTSKANEATVNKTANGANEGTILFTEAGKRGVATAYRIEGKFDTQVVIKWAAKGKKTLHTTATLVDLRSMKSENLQEALAKVVHSTGHLALFETTEIKGKRGMVRVFLNPKNGNGYATLVRKGRKPFSFSLDRVDLAAMKSKDHKEAFEKAAWATGSIAVIKSPEAPKATEATEAPALPAAA